jgi:hypothetical protein
MSVKVEKTKQKITEKSNKNQEKENKKCNMLVNKVVKISMKYFDIGIY